MCFSPQADLIGGLVISALGADAIRHVQRPREIAIAALPLLLGLHQLVEAFVWWRLQGHVPAALGNTAMWVYLVFAFVVLPPFVPLTIIAMEPTRGRRRLMMPFAAIGACVSVVLLAAMIRGPVTAELDRYHLAYRIELRYGGLIVALYVIATCGSLLMSGYKQTVIFGAVNLPVIAVLGWTASNGFASLWCAWAAIASGAIAAHLRLTRAYRQPGGVGGVGG